MKIDRFILYTDFIKNFFFAENTPKIKFSSIESHKKRIKKLTEEIKIKKGIIQVVRGRRKHFIKRDNYVNYSDFLDISDMCHILEINIDEKYILVEPLVTIENIVDSLYDKKYRPNVVPEFKTITTGGAISGIAGESTSNNFGLFHEPKNLLEIELVTGDGKLKKINTNNPDDKLYSSAIPGSLGTLGVITSAKIRIEPCRQFVDLNCVYTKDLNVFLKIIKNKEYDFIEAIYFENDTLCIVTGKEVDHPSNILFKQNRLSKWFDDYLIEGIKNEQSMKFSMNLYDYLFRWDRGCFFNGSQRFGSSLINRFIFGGKYSRSETFYRLGEYRYWGNHISQDCIIPLSKFKFFIENLKEIYPKNNRIWLLPITISSGTLFGPQKGSWINIGLYNKVQNIDLFEKIEYKLEDLIINSGGLKTLYAPIYKTYRDNFWNIYDKTLYEKMREELESKGVFPDITEKVFSKNK